MSSSMTFFLFVLCFTAATASPVAARGYPPTVTPSVPVPPSHPPSVPVPPSYPPSVPVPPSHTPTVPVPPTTTSCPPTVTAPPTVPPCTKNCTAPVPVPPCTTNCPPAPPVNPPCTKDCPPVPPVTPPCTKDCPSPPQGSGCHPNFAGAALTLATSGPLYWSAQPIVSNPLTASSSPSKFFFQQNGFPTVSYTVKTVDNVNFALEAKGGAPLIENVDPSGSNQNQKWFVDCSPCSSADISQTKGKVASGCKISSGSDTNKQCITAKAPGATTLAACDGSGAQLFDFTAV
ncbi:hypothetical protein EDD18DRAFT_678564 [Armillaria luteobubalina]|uniref:Ricin B lectin domain-containing protein n=1 Tax=Armillaria luteobubalina TaxID=153913 RepID=A0AA39UXK5_9AGAR|nr:hypothetical protein EDD18DRAFT_678564 [Armillaria luteobubalina]